MRHLYYSSILIGFLTLIGCNSLYNKEIEQQIVGSLLIDNKPATGISVAIIGREAKGNCNQSKIKAITDEKGRFFQVRKALNGRLAVLVQDDTLCIFDNNKWQAIWHSNYGPTPKELKFTCTRSGNSNWLCTMNGLASLKPLPNGN